MYSIKFSLIWFPELPFSDQLLFPLEVREGREIGIIYCMSLLLTRFRVLHCSFRCPGARFDISSSLHAVQKTSITDNYLPGIQPLEDSALLQRIITSRTESKFALRQPLLKLIKYNCKYGARNFRIWLITLLPDMVHASTDGSWIRADEVLACCEISLIKWIFLRWCWYQPIKIILIQLSRKVSHGMFRVFH